jgi:hypothetical protein
MFEDNDILESGGAAILSGTLVRFTARLLSGMTCDHFLLHAMYS